MLGRIPMPAIIAAVLLAGLAVALWIRSGVATKPTYQQSPLNDNASASPPEQINGSTQSAETAKSAPLQISNCADQTHIVVAGDTLWGIALVAYHGRGYLYRLIAEANPGKVKQGWLIIPGAKLTIPCNICNLPAIAPALLTTTKYRKSQRAIAKVQPKSACPPAAPCVQVAKSSPVASPAHLSQPPAPQKTVPQQTAQKQTAPPAKVAAAAPLPQQQKQQQTVIVVPPEAAPTPQPERPKQATQTLPQKEEIPKPEAKSLSTPGSLWNTLLTEPIERGNKVDYFHLDQGVVIGSMKGIQIEPYVAINAVKDTAGFSWNNRVEGEAGLKLVKSFSHGVVILGGAYAEEWRQSMKTQTGVIPSSRRSAPIGYIQDWFGWSQPTSRPSKRKFFAGFPGSTWLIAGNVSPYEENNVIGLARVEQGVTVLKFTHLALIPTATFQIGADTDKRPWNNRYTAGAMLKVAVPATKGAFDVEGGYECTRQYRGAPMGIGTSADACGPTVRLNLWTGWRHFGGR